MLVELCYFGWSLYICSWNSVFCVCLLDCTAEKGLLMALALWSCCSISKLATTSQTFLVLDLISSISPLPESSLLLEIQTQRGTCYTVSFIQNIRQTKSITIENISVLAVHSKWVQILEYNLHLKSWFQEIWFLLCR